MGNLLLDKLDLKEVELFTEQHMMYWQNFRQSATPIFEWLYKVSRERMEGNMLVDTDALIADFKNSSCYLFTLLVRPSRSENLGAKHFAAKPHLIKVKQINIPALK